MVGMQIAMFFVAIRNSFDSAILCLLIPFYVYVYAKKDPQAKPFLWAWYAGVGLLIAGVIASA